MMKRILTSTCIVAALVALIACQRETVEFAPPTPDEGPSFSNSADSGSTDASEAGLTAYCPTNQCPAGWTTCPGSRFQCNPLTNGVGLAT